MKRIRIIIGLVAVLLVSLASSPVSASTGKDAQRDIGIQGACIWGNVFTWDTGSADSPPSSEIPAFDGDPGSVDWLYTTTNKCADINIALSSRPQPAQTIGVRVCFPQPNNVVCDSWKFWGSGYSGWLELNDEQPSIPDGRKFIVQMYGVDPYTTGYIAF